MRSTFAHRFIALAVGAAAFTGYACAPDSTQLTGWHTAGTAGGTTADGGSASTPGASSGGDDGGAGAVTPATPFARRVRRLTRVEYKNTLNDLLGTTTDYSANLPADSTANGFDDDADALEVDQLFADEARINAEAIAAAFDLGSIGCAPSAGDACARTFATAFGQKALRRPLTDAEVASYATLADQVAQTSDAALGIRAVIEAMLQSASFLYRTELGGDASGDSVTLTPWEIASELSYLFWRSMPDDELRQHAQAGDLAQPSVVASEVTRLLASPRANAMLDAFADQWLETNLLPQAQKDPTAFPMYGAPLQSDLAGEVHALFESSARDPNGTLSGLLTANYSYLTPALAQLYGVSIGQGASTNGFVKTTMPSGRGGLLTLGAVLAVQATPLAANPVRRGKLVRTQLFCQPVPPPPSGVAGQIPPLDPNTANKQSWQQHSTDPACSGCHKLLDPIGFGFDQFDAVGRLLPGTIDSSGQIEGTPSSDATFTDAIDLEHKLAASADVQSCFVKQWVRFGLGVADTSDSDTEVTRLVGTFQKGAVGVQPLLTAITQAPYFFTRKSEVIPSP
jgi:hypothetical protein